MIKKKVTKNKKKNGMSTSTAVAIGAGVAAVSAGAYYFLKPNKKHTTEIKALATKLKTGWKKTRNKKQRS